jgi:hypothetical protein
MPALNQELNLINTNSRRSRRFTQNCFKICVVQGRFKKSNLTQSIAEKAQRATELRII